MMVNLKTKSEKHINDNEKRRKSVIEKEKTKLNQLSIIKQALSNSTLHDNSSKKIVFDDEEDINFEKTKYRKKHLNKNGKSRLFDNSESENEDVEIKEKIQFSGEKGYKLLNLQSTYGNDERFKIDERFIEDEEEDFYQYKNEKPINEQEAEGEKAKQLRILESVLGTPIKPDQEKKLKKRTHEMIRYDATNKDHEIYEIKNQSKIGLDSLSLSKKKKERNKKPKTDREKETKPIVSKEKFYEVSNEIKNCFNEKKEENNQFSILQTYGLSDIEPNLGIEESVMKQKVRKKEEDEESDFVDGENFGKSNSHNIKRINKEIINETKKEEKSVIAEGIWKESFFFIQDDPRIKEGLEFINKKDSQEASEAAENYDRMRKVLKEILRLHLKKQLRNKDPFKNKIGGMNKRQLANSKFKNSKMTFNKKKRFKKNPVAKV